MRKCLVFDKKLKSGGKKVLKASYANCSPALFAALFPHAGGKQKVLYRLAWTLRGHALKSRRLESGTNTRSVRAHALRR